MGGTANTRTFCDYLYARCVFEATQRLGTETDNKSAWCASVIDSDRAEAYRIGAFHLVEENIVTEALALNQNAKQSRLAATFEAEMWEIEVSPIFAGKCVGYLLRASTRDEFMRRMIVLFDTMPLVYTV